MVFGAKPAKRNSSTSKMAFKETQFNMSSEIEVVWASQRIPAPSSREAIAVRAMQVRRSSFQRPAQKMKLYVKQLQVLLVATLPPYGVMMLVRVSFGSTH